MERRAHLLALLLAAGSGACATVPGPGDPAYPYNLRGTYAGPLTLGDSTHHVTLDAETLPDGTVRGALRAEEPPTFSGDFSGSIRGDSLVWRSSWVQTATGCSGLVRGWGVVDEGGTQIEGRLLAEGDCPSGNGAGAFRFSR